MGAARALGTIQPIDPIIHQALARAVGDTVKSVARSAAQALIKIAQKDSHVLDMITHLLKYSGDDFVSTVRADPAIPQAFVVRLSDPDPMIRKNAASALREVTQLLNHSNSNVVQTALWILREVKQTDLATLSAIVEVLKRPEELLRRDALETLYSLNVEGPHFNIEGVPLRSIVKDYLNDTHCSKPIHEVISMKQIQLILDSIRSEAGK